MNKKITVEDHYKFMAKYNEEMAKPLNIITDMDEVLVDIAPTWAKIILDNPQYFQDFFDLERDYTKKDIHERDEYYLNKWLLKHPTMELPKGVFELFMAAYNRDDFYTNLKPTKLGLYLKEFINTDHCSTITVISDTLPGMEDQKYEWLMRNLFDELVDEDKFHFIPVNNIPKSNVINDLELEYDTFIDDKLDNVIDVIMNTDSEGKEILIPRKGYNQLEPEHKILIDAAYVNVQYYEE